MENKFKAKKIRTVSKKNNKDEVQDVQFVVVVVPLKIT